MSYDRDGPGPPQDPLPLAPAHVVHVRVVFGETEDSATKSITSVKSKKAEVLSCGSSGSVLLERGRDLLLHLRTPQVVFLPVHADGQLAKLPLLYGVAFGCDGADFVKLRAMGTMETNGDLV